MRYFRHVTAEYSCLKCGQRRSVIAPTLSPFFLILAAAFTLPTWVIAFIIWRLPWYHLLGIYAGELLMIFAAGFLSSFFLLLDSMTCPRCRKAMLLNGRHFDPLGSKRPHWKDMLLLVVFIGMNVLLWIQMRRM